MRGRAAASTLGRPIGGALVPARGRAGVIQAGGAAKNVPALKNKAGVMPINVEARVRAAAGPEQDDGKREVLELVSLVRQGCSAAAIAAAALAAAPSDRPGLGDSETARAAEACWTLYRILSQNDASGDLMQRAIEYGILEESMRLFVLLFNSSLREPAGPSGSEAMSAAEALMAGAAFVVGLVANSTRGQQARTL